MVRWTVTLFQSNATKNRAIAPSRRVSHGEARWSAGCGFASEDWKRNVAALPA